MKKIMICACALASLTVGAQTNSPDADGYISRASVMMQQGNYIGCIDQLRRAQQLPLSAHQECLAALWQAQATVSVSKPEAAILLSEWIEKYPESPLRNDALLSLGDCFSGEKALAIYEKVNPNALTDNRRDELYYRMACACLSVGQLDRAGSLLAKLERSGRYASAARFQRGYVAYAKGDFKRALPLFEQSKADPNLGSAADFYLAQMYYSQEQWNKAYGSALSALNSAFFSDSPQAIAMRAEATRIAGESAFRLGNDRQAKQMLRAYRDMAPMMQPSASYILGLYAYADQNLNDAISLMRPAIKAEDAMSQSAYLYIGQALLKQGDFDGAILAFDKALNMDFDRDVQQTAYYNYAVASLQGGKVPFGNAVGTFESFLRKFPDSKFAPEAQNYIVATYVNNGEYDKAVASINAMRSPSEQTLQAKQRALYMLGMQELEAGLAKQAIGHLQEARQLAKYDSQINLEATLILGEAYYRNGEYDKSAQMLQQYIKEAPARAANLPIAHYDLGYALFAQKKYGQAQTQFSKFTSAAANAPANIVSDAYCRIGDCLFQEKKYSDAASAYDRAFETNPSVGDYALFQKALMLGYQRRHADKIDMMRSMMEQFPSSPLAPDAMLEMTESYIQLGNNDAAIDVYRDLISAYPNTAQARQGELQMALTMLNAGYRQQAVEAYKHVIATYPTSDEAQIASDQLKRAAAADGTLADYMAFMASVPNAPKVDASEVEMLAFEAAEMEYIESQSTDKLLLYAQTYAQPDATQNPANAARALAYLAENAYANGDSDLAYGYACSIADRFPDSAVAVDALQMKATIEESQGKGMLALQTWENMAQKASNAYAANVARLGVARCAVAAEQYQQAIDAASSALASSSLPQADRNQALMLRGQAKHAMADIDGARADWEQAAGHPADASSIQSEYLLADSYFRQGELDQAESLAKAVTSSSSPHAYWVARAFILLSDIYAAQGNEYKSQQYLRSLQNNYPGQEADIFLMIEQRLAAE